ncbi:cell division protein SepF [Streptomyces sp. NPDC056909]|uniref:cell division protein SepF n=1 Tax=Streptomyces TaxID=1883 RepID=UPI00081F54B9|nr:MULTISPECIES: cell division protein SepF [Streptomyces]MYZ39488.1 cell division protein SepF [Streptomyces sp. SID4917]WSZ02817.1 cell division protein SepF [Streptomyces sp. NBC_00872]SCG03972.1 cell division inhibitor SepF [Streptomyces sp. MnatMP-M17]
MAGAMRKMAVYLGLVEDDGYDGRGFDPDDDFEPEPEPEREHRRHQPVHQQEREREREREEPMRVVQPPAQREREREPVSLGAEIGRPARIAPVASITPERPSLEKNAPVIMPKVVSEREPYRITTLHPRTYNEARTIGEHFREGTPVIMNLTEMDDTDAKRLVDFAAGLVFGLHGSIERVTQKVFLLSPANVDVTAEDKARIAEGGFFNQS